MRQVKRGVDSLPPAVEECAWAQDLLSPGTILTCDGLARTRSSTHGAGDLAKYFTDRRCDTGHNCSGGDRYKTRHQRILNEVLATGIGPNPYSPNGFHECFHFLTSQENVKHETITTSALRTTVDSTYGY
jgi:hypothetical protein